MSSEQLVLGGVRTPATDGTTFAVIEPAQLTPLSVLTLADILMEAGLPPDVISVSPEAYAQASSQSTPAIAYIPRHLLAATSKAGLVARWVCTRHSFIQK